MEWTAKENIEIFGDPAHWFDYIEREEKVRMRINCGFVVDFARETLLPPFGMNGNTLETKPTANVYTNRFGIEFMGNYWLSLPFFCSTSNCTALRSLEVERTSGEHWSYQTQIEDSTIQKKTWWMNEALSILPTTGRTLHSIVAWASLLN